MTAPYINGQTIEIEACYDPGGQPGQRKIILQGFHGASGTYDARH
jgi:hypothetical protein